MYFGEDSEMVPRSHLRVGAVGSGNINILTVPKHYSLFGVLLFQCACGASGEARAKSHLNVRSRHLYSVHALIWKLKFFFVGTSCAVNSETVKKNMKEA